MDIYAITSHVEDDDFCESKVACERFALATFCRNHLALKSNGYKTSLHPVNVNGDTFTAALDLMHSHVCCRTGA
jgi:hypothetical protein